MPFSSFVKKPIYVKNNFEFNSTDFFVNKSIINAIIVFILCTAWFCATSL
jgi:hypothetical protein